VENQPVKPYYEDANTTIYHGDALEVLPELDYGYDAVLTDPPYVIGAVSAGNMESKSGGWADMMNSATWFVAWYSQVNRILKRSGVFWTCCNWRSLPVVMRAASDARLPVTSLAVWDKQWIGPGGTQGLRPSYELVAMLAGPEYAIKNRGIPDIIRVPTSAHKPTGHPDEKPLPLMERILTISELEPGAAVLDPFLGSGTTLRAAKNLGLRGVGIEAEERYCELAAQRMAQEVLPF